MNENIENIKLDEILEEIQYLKHENNTLKKHNRVLSNELTYFKEYSADLEDKINENAGHQFAQELLGHHMTPEEVAIEQAENCYVPYNGDDF